MTSLDPKAIASKVSALMATADPPTTEFVGVAGAAMLDAVSRVTASEETRIAAHAQLEEWLAECERQSPECFKSGCFGHIGRFELRADVDDTEITLVMERSVARELP